RTSRLTISNEGKVAVRSSHHVNQVIDRPQGNVHPILGTHEAEPTAEEPFSVLQAHLGWSLARSRQNRAVSDHRDLSRGQTATRGYDRLAGTVAGDGVIGHSVPHPHQPANH